jgi:hypothetical protein
VRTVKKCVMMIMKMSMMLIVPKIAARSGTHAN